MEKAQTVFCLTAHYRGPKIALVGDGAERFRVQAEGLDEMIEPVDPDSEDGCRAYDAWCLRWRADEEEEMRIGEHLDKLMDEMAPLYHRYRGQTGPQDAYVQINPGLGIVDVSYNAEIGNAVPMDVWHGRRLRIELTPYIRGDRLVVLLRAILPLAQRVADGYSEHWDAQNNVGKLTDDAREAREEIREMCEAEGERADDLAQVWEAGDWVAPETRIDWDRGRVKVAGGEYVITRRTGERRLQQIATKLEREAEADGIYLDGDMLAVLQEYQRRLRQG